MTFIPHPYTDDGAPKLWRRIPVLHRKPFRLILQSRSFQNGHIYNSGGTGTLIRSVVDVVQRSDGRVLLAECPKAMVPCGFWEFPCGMELGLLDTAVHHGAHGIAVQSEIG